MKRELHREIEKRLLSIVSEIEKQPSAIRDYSKELLPIEDVMKQVHEYIEIAGEYEVAYEALVSTVEAGSFIITSKSAISLLEAGLLMGYKTSRKEDEIFDRR